MATSIQLIQRKSLEAGQIPPKYRAYSYSPHRQSLRAQLKSQASEKAPSQTDIEAASKPADSYVVAVIGLPKGIADPQSLGTAASLTPNKKDPIKSTQVKVQPVGNGEAYVFTFPKSTPLAVEDKDVEFRLEAGKLDIKKKFSLKDMQYQGKLAI